MTAQPLLDHRLGLPVQSRGSAYYDDVLRFGLEAQGDFQGRGGLYDVCHSGNARIQRKSVRRGPIIRKAENHGDASKRTFVGFQYELQWRWANRDDHVRFAILILAKKEVAELPLSFRTRKQFCFHIIAIELKSIWRV